MSEYLPQEVIVEILLRLPIKSIIQCTSVCKSWYSLITSPSFFSTHLNNQDNHLLVRYIDPQELKRDGYREYAPVQETYALYCDNDNFDHYVHFDVPFTNVRGSHFNIGGCCNGLLSLTDDLHGYIEVFFLWNPSIGKLLELPTPIFIYKTHGPFDHTHGFGFDRVTNEYKVVRIVHTGANCDRVPPNVELYKLSTGVWQDITHVSPAYRFFKKKPGVFLNGACHWVVENSRMMVLFDVQNETFTEMMQPPGLVFDRYCADWFDLFVSEESLCLANHLFDDDKTVDIWRMREYGDPESWVKQFSVSSSITFNVGIVDELYSMFHDGRQRRESRFLVKTLASRRNGEILCKAGNGLLVSYDIAAKKIKNLGVRNSNSSLFHDALYVNKYKMSLILLDKQTDHFAEDTGEESSNLCLLKPTGGRKVLKIKTKRGLQIVFPLQGIEVHVQTESKDAPQDKTKEQVLG